MARIGEISDADFVQRKARAAAKLTLELQAQARILDRIEQLFLDLRGKRKLDPYAARGRVLEDFGIRYQRGNAPFAPRLLTGRARAPLDLHRHHPPKMLLDERGVIGIE